MNRLSDNTNEDFFNSFEGWEESQPRKEFIDKFLEEYEPDRNGYHGELYTKYRVKCILNDFWDELKKPRR